MGELRKNVFHIYKSSGYVGGNEEIEPLYHNSLQVQQMKGKKPSKGVAPLYPLGVHINQGQSFQVEDPEVKPEIVAMPGIRQGSLKIPLSTVATIIQQKVLEHVERYPKGTTAIQVKSVNEDGTFNYVEHFMGQATEKMGNWILGDDMNIKVLIDNKTI